MDPSRVCPLVPLGWTGSEEDNVWLTFSPVFISSVFADGRDWMVGCLGQRPFESNMYLTSDMRWKHLEATCVIFQSFGHEEKCAHVVDTSHIRKAVENERRARLTAAFATKVPNLFGDESKFTKTNPPSNDGTGKQWAHPCSWKAAAIYILYIYYILAIYILLYLYCIYTIYPL